MRKIGAKEAAMRAQREISMRTASKGTGPMTKAEAKDITRRINAAAGSLSDLLNEAHERLAWKALGYTSWREYATAEFQISQTKAYQLLTQARVQKAIQAASFSAGVEITEAESRVLAPNLPEVVAEIRARTEVGGTAEEVVAEVVRRRREQHREEAQDTVTYWRARYREIAALLGVDDLDQVVPALRHLLQQVRS